MNCISQLIIAFWSSFIIWVLLFQSSFFLLLFSSCLFFLSLYSPIFASTSLSFLSISSMFLVIFVVFSIIFVFPLHFLHMVFLISWNSTFSCFLNSSSILSDSVFGIFSSISSIFLSFFLISNFSINSACFSFALWILSCRIFSFSLASLFSCHVLSFSVRSFLHSLIISQLFSSICAFLILESRSSFSFLLSSCISANLFSQSTSSQSTASFSIWPRNLYGSIFLLLDRSSLSSNSTSSSLLGFFICFTTLKSPSSLIFLFFSILYQTSSCSLASSPLFLHFSFLLLLISCLTSSSFSLSSNLYFSSSSFISLIPIFAVRRGMVHLLYSALLFNIKFLSFSLWMVTLSRICLSKAEYVYCTTLIPNLTSSIFSSLWFVAICFNRWLSSSNFSRAVRCSSPRSYADRAVSPIYLCNLILSFLSFFSSSPISNSSMYSFSFLTQVSHQVS